MKAEAYKSSINREEKKEDTYTPSYRREEKKDEGYGSRYSSLRDEKKMENGESNGHSSTPRNTTTLHIEEQPTPSRFGSIREDKKEEINGSSKLEEVSPKYKGYESILAKYGTAHQAPTSQAPTSPSLTSPATTVASPTTDTTNCAPASYNNSAQYTTSTATTSTSDSASSSRPTTSSLPVPGSTAALPSPYSRTNSNTSTSSLAVPGNASLAYSRTNSNTSTTGADPPFGSSPYTRQLSKENNGGGAGHLADESSLSRSLERRASSKKLPFGPSGPAPPTFSAFEKTIEKSNSIQEKIEATLNKHNVGPKQVILVFPVFARPKYSF